MNTEAQFVDGKQYSDLNSREKISKFHLRIYFRNTFFVLFFFLYTVCGSNKPKEKLDEATMEILQSQVEEGGFGTCTSVVVSDKYAITAAHCIFE